MDKPLAGFCKQSSNRDGLRNWCRVCTAAYAATYSRKNVKKLRALNRLTQLRKYGITLQQYADLQQAQGNKCAVCLHEEREGKQLSVDHCHTTGEVRGLVCHNCNVALGHLKDSSINTASALIYLAAHGGALAPPDAVDFIRTYTMLVLQPKE